jgi:hypothetical protein
MKKLSSTQFIKVIYLLEAITNRVVTDIKSRFKLPVLPDSPEKRANKNLPVSDEELRNQLQYFESLSPDKQSPAQYTLFLANTAYSTPPSWLINEDEVRVIPLLKRAYAAKITDLTQFKTTQALEQQVNMNEKESVIGISNEEMPHVTAGAKKVGELGEWSLWKVPMGNTDVQAKAAQLLCSNKRHNTHWCVGYDAPGAQVRNYLANGDFFVFQKHGQSKYAVSTNKETGNIIIWNPADSQIFNSETSGSTESNSKFASLFPSLASIDPSIGEKLSYIPEELKAPLAAAQKNPEAAILNKVPSRLLQVYDEASLLSLYRALHIVSIPSLIRDLNAAVGSQSESNATMAASVMSYLTNNTRGRDLTNDELELFTVPTFLGYLEAYASNHNKTMAKHIEKFILEHM